MGFAVWAESFISFVLAKRQRRHVPVTGPPSNFKAHSWATRIGQFAGLSSKSNEYRVYLFSFLKKRSGTSIEKGEQQQTSVFEGLLEEGRGEGMKVRKRVEEEGEEED